MTEQLVTEDANRRQGYREVSRISLFQCPRFELHLVSKNLLVVVVRKDNGPGQNLSGDKRCRGNWKQDQELERGPHRFILALTI